ncbi:MAG: YfhO family protein [bacterium]|nr:YfhO family protein [bacterium]
MRGKNYLSIGILIILTVVYFWKFFFLGLIPLGGDIATYTYPPWYFYYHDKDKSQNPLLSDPVFLHYPLRKLASERLNEGKITLWNPYLFCGYPMFSTNSVSFSPLNLFFLFSKPLIAYSLIIFCQLLLCGIFMYIFLRGSLCLGPFPALIGSIVYEFSGFHIVWLEMGILSGFLLPMILFLIDKALTKRNMFYVSLAGFALGVQFLSTFLQISLFVLSIVIPYALFRIWGQTSLLRLIRFMGLIGLIGFSLSAVQLIPSYELIKQSHRSPIDDYRKLSPLPWQNLITFLVPNYYGNPVDFNYNIVRGKFRAVFEKYGLKLPPLHPKRGIMEDNYNEHCAYIGILPLLLAMLAIFLKRNKETVFFGSWTLISLLLVLGTPLYYLLYRGIPGYDKLIISRLVFLYTFGVTVLAALSCHYLSDLPKRFKVYAGGIVLLCGAITLISLYLGKWVATFSIANDTLANYFPKANARFAQHFSLLNPDFLTPILLLLCSGIVLLGINKVRISWLKIAILSIIVFDLFYFGLRYNPFVPKQELYLTPPPLKFLADKISSDGEKSRVLAFEHLMPVSINIIYGFETAEGYDGMFPKRYDEFMNLVDPYSSGWENVKELHYFANRKLLCLLNTKYLIAEKEIVAPNLKLVFDDGWVKIYEDQYALPRAFIVPVAKVIKDKNKIFKELLSEDFDPRKTVILEEEYREQQIKIQNLSNPQSKIQNPKTKILDYQPEKVIIKTTLNKNGFLVLSDTYYPGWQVFVDGKREKLYCADYILRAVYLGAGEHLVEFRYSPLSFRLGSIISIATLIILLINIGFICFIRPIGKRSISV